MPVDVTETNDITHDIIGSAIEVHKALGPGLLESAYRPVWQSNYLIDITKSNSRCAFRLSIAGSVWTLAIA